jgi:hypothetical protein
MDVHRAEITSLAARYRLPAVYPFRQFSEVGGLLSYGNDQVDNYRRVAVYVDRILRGAKPSEPPIQAPVKWANISRARKNPLREADLRSGSSGDSQKLWIGWLSPGQQEGLCGGFSHWSAMRAWSGRCLQ